jgi:hypothetical protein
MQPENALCRAAYGGNFGLPKALAEGFARLYNPER